ncbi:MAG: hypothetical protein WCI27_08430, partial [Candidatus Omnitrophota bacterium]
MRPDVKKWPVMAMVLICLFFTWRAWQANTDLVDGRYRLFMDEQITFDDVKAMLQAPSLKDAVLVSMAGDPRYGRGLYNLSYLVSFVPYKIWGDAGLIVADRMLQFVLLMLAYVLLVMTFIRAWPLRALVVTSLLCLPSTVYYATMPKPEPLQIFCLALFLFFAGRNKFAFGAYYFFLGCALGMKVSALVLMPLFAVLAVSAHREYWPGRKYYAQGLIALFSVVMGYIIMQGTLIRCLVVRNLEALNLYGWFLSHESHASVTGIPARLMGWFRFFFIDYFQQPPLVTGFICLGAAALAGVMIRDGIEGKGRLTGGIANPVCVLVVTGLALLGFIMLFADSQRAFYLHAGMVFMTVAGGALCAAAWEKGSAFSAEAKFVAAGVLFLFCVSLMFLMPAANQDYLKEAGRTKTAGHQARLAEYRRIHAAAEAVAGVEGRRLQIAYDPELYQLDNTPQYHVSRFWSAQVPWGSPYDAIILYNGDVTRPHDAA